MYSGIIGAENISIRRIWIYGQSPQETWLLQETLKGSITLILFSVTKLKAVDLGTTLNNAFIMDTEHYSNDLKKIHIPFKRVLRFKSTKQASQACMYVDIFSISSLYLFQPLQISPFSQDHTYKYLSVCTHPCLFLTRLLFLAFVHLHFTKINFPQQTIQLLLVTPIAIQHQRDNTEQHQRAAGNARRYLTSITCK